MRQTDEKIIIAPLSCGSIRGAAAALGCSQRTVTDRLKKPEFVEKYNAAKSEQLQAVCAAMISTLCKAVKTLETIASDKTAVPTARTQAADALLRHGLRYLEAADFERRLTALEQAANRKENDK